MSCCFHDISKMLGFGYVKLFQISNMSSCVTMLPTDVHSVILSLVKTVRPDMSTIFILPLLLNVT